MDRFIEVRTEDIGGAHERSAEITLLDPVQNQPHGLPREALLTRGLVRVHERAEVCEPIQVMSPVRGTGVVVPVDVIRKLMRFVVEGEAMGQNLLCLPDVFLPRGRAL